MKPDGLLKVLVHVLGVIWASCVIVRGWAHSLKRWVKRWSNRLLER